jgi:dephospho-CoA kinase
MLIGFGISKQVGKDTVSKYLKERYGFIQRAFADPLKKACKIIFCLDEDQVNGDLKEVIDERWNLTPRQLMQIVGTDLFRNKLTEIIPSLDHSIWLKNFEFWYEKNKRYNVVVSDVRFLNEVELIKKLGGKVIKINRDNNLKRDVHSSEIELENYKDFDYVIDNIGTFEELYKKVDFIIKDIVF